MKFVFEVELSNELDNTNNFKRLMGKFFLEVLDRIPDNSRFDGVMDNPDNRTVRFENCKAMLLSNVSTADDRDGKPVGTPVVVAQALITDAAFTVLDPVTLPTDKRTEERVILER